MKQYCIRGAITIEENTYDEIKNNTIMLLEEIISKNNLQIADFSSIIFTTTRDITKAYPARFAREIGFTNCSLMCVQEMYVENSLDYCIRVLANINKAESENFVPKNVYLKGAKALRPDLTDK